MTIIVGSLMIFGLVRAPARDAPSTPHPDFSLLLDAAIYASFANQIVTIAVF